MYVKITTLTFLSVLLSTVLASFAYPVDCITSFDASCMKKKYGKNASKGEASTAWKEPHTAQEAYSEYLRTRDRKMWLLYIELRDEERAEEQSVHQEEYEERMEEIDAEYEARREESELESQKDEIRWELRWDKSLRHKSEVGQRIEMRKRGFSKEATEDVIDLGGTMQRR